MKPFLKVNGFSVFYAFMLFVPLELIMNVYRISRLTGMELSTVIVLIGITIMIEVGVGSFIAFSLSSKLLDDRKANFWIVILWVPYFVLFVYSLSTLFPITYGGESPGPALGLLAVGAFMVYPFYIVTILFLSASREEHMSTVTGK
ncbi:hypothetical protein [Alkalihalobacillus sp. R86527]|uniref:hypothetical protein n=1 Tax=Alkalihalobacillus sp. R86527 TaxID=3093863 RepID=UPI00366EC1B7